MFSVSRNISQAANDGGAAEGEMALMMIPAALVYFFCSNYLPPQFMASIFDDSVGVFSWLFVLLGFQLLAVVQWAVSP